MGEEIKKRVDRFRLDIEDESTKDSRLSIDIPTYFKIDESALWKAVMREMTKQEKKASECEWYQQVSSPNLYFTECLRFYNNDAEDIKSDDLKKCPYCNKKIKLDKV